MSNTRDTGFLRNAVQVTNQGIVFVSGSTLLMSISASGAVTTTGVISGSNALSSSYAQTSSFAITSLSGTGSFTGSFSGIHTGSLFGTSSNAFSSSYSATASYANTFTVGSTLTAQTLVVQTITSSIEYSSGSNIFGSSLSNTQTFTGSVNITGSQNIFGNVGTNYAAQSNIRSYIYDNSANYGLVVQQDGSGAIAQFSGVSGAVRMYISASGNVGIGTSSPLYKLSVANELQVGAQGGSDMTYIAGGSGFGSIITQYYATGPINNKLRGNGDNYFNIIVGNFGIGNSSPSYSLDVTGTGRFTGAVTFGSTLAVTSTISAGIITGDGGSTGTPGIVAKTGGGGNNGTFGFGNSSSYRIRGGSDYAKIIFDAGTADQMTLTSGGSVGIGTTSPGRLLTVYNGSADPFISIYGGASNEGGLLFGSTSTNDAYGQIRYSNSSNFMYFVVNSGERMRITSGGNVGIGVTNPEVSFVVKGTSIGSGGKASFYGGGDENNWSAANNEAIRIGRADILNAYYSSIWSASGSSGNNRLHWLKFYITNGSNAQTLACSMFGDGSVDVAGALSKGSGSFRIKHPLVSKKNTHQLVHSFIEGPQADLIYRGKVRLVAGRATINIDEAATMTEGTFEALCREIQCFTSNETGWDTVRGKVEGNILTIECQNTESTDEISWLVIGERQDEHMYETNWTDENGKVIVEPLIPEQNNTNN